MPCWPVSHRDGIYQVTDVDGIHYPITLGRRPVERFNPGWYPVGLQTGLRPFHLLELRNDDGPDRDAVWYLSDELDFVSNAARHFNPDQVALVVGSLSPLLRDIFDQTLCAPSPDIADSTHAFDGINPLFVRELVGIVVETALSPPDTVAVQQLGELSSHYMAGSVRLSASLLRHCLDIEMPGAAEEGLAVASPFDATLVKAQEHFAPGGEALARAYRFYDPTGEAAFYVLFGNNGAPALYVPAMNTVFAAQEGLSGAEAMTALLSYYASHTDRDVRVPLLLPAAPAPEPVQALAAPTPVQAAADREVPAVEAPARAHGVAEAHDATAAAGDVGVLAEQDHAETSHTNWWKRLFGLGSP